MDLKTGRPWLQKRFILPSAALAVAIAFILVVSTLNRGTSDPAIAGAASQAAATISTPDSTPEATDEPSAAPTESVIPAPVVSDSVELTPLPGDGSTGATQVPSPVPVQQNAPGVQDIPASTEPTITCPTKGLTVTPGPVSVTSPVMEGYYDVVSGGTVTNRSSAKIDLWDRAPEIESLDVSGNRLAQTWGSKFVYSASAGQPKDLKFSLSPGETVPYVIDAHLAIVDFKKHVSWYTVTSSMTWGWTAPIQYQGECANPPLEVLQ